MGLIYGGYGNPDLWDTPISNTVTLEIPDDAEPGTYEALIKASRYYLGETCNVLDSIPFQVGTEQQTHRSAPAGNCDVCHNGNGRLKRMRHQTADATSCSVCHNRPYALAGQVLHELHFFSDNSRQKKNDCSLCHIEPGSNARVSLASCGVCHENIHQGEFDLGYVDQYQRCGLSCHGDQVHVTGGS
jgi:hypothetical protein